MSRECVTHFHACDCREKEFADAVKENAELRILHGKAMIALRECREVLEFYGDGNEWDDFKATATASNGERVQVDSHFDSDYGAKARAVLAKLREVV